MAYQRLVDLSAGTIESIDQTTLQPRPMPSAKRLSWWVKVGVMALCVIAMAQVFTVIRDLYVYYKVNQAVTNVKEAVTGIKK